MRDVEFSEPLSSIEKSDWVAWREIKKENACLRFRLASLEEAAKDILANGYDQGRRIKLRAALFAYSPLKEG